VSKARRVFDRITSPDTKRHAFIPGSQANGVHRIVEHDIKGHIASCMRETLIHDSIGSHFYSNRQDQSDNPVFPEYKPSDNFYFPFTLVGGQFGGNRRDDLARLHTFVSCN
jgi:hypothetical protein